MMARGLAGCDDQGPVDDGFNEIAGDLCVGDALDQDVALRDEPSHGSNLLRDALNRPGAISAAPSRAEAAVLACRKLEGLGDQHD
jgi:hypothetical protein